MARSRNIKPGFYKNEDLAECSIWARFIFPGLWMLADREGRLEDRPKRIKGELLPFDNQDVDRLLDELKEREFILRYQVGADRYIQILAFERHQHPHHKEPRSTIPKPETPPPMQRGASPGLDAHATAAKPEASPRPAPDLPRSSPSDSGFLIPDSGKPSSPSDDALPSASARTSRSEASPSLSVRTSQIAIQIRGLEKSRNKHPRITSTDPRVGGWAKSGVTDDQIRQAYDLAVAAREAEKDPSSINAGFLDIFVQKVLNPKPPANGSWWESEEATIAEAARRGVETRSGESWGQFRDRIRQAPVPEKEAA